MQQVGDWCCRNEGSIYVNRGFTQNGRKTKGKLVCNYANDWIGVGYIWLKRRHFFSTGSCVRKGIWIVELLSPAISNFHLKLWLVVTGTMEFWMTFQSVENVIISTDEVHYLSEGQAQPPKQQGGAHGDDIVYHIIYHTITHFTKENGDLKLIYSS